MRFSNASPVYTFATILSLTSKTLAQFTVEALSFGHLDVISPDVEARFIPGWTLAGDGTFQPPVLSDRIILTPPAPGNKRGGLYATHALTYPEWEVKAEFRASGQERGSGNMQIWLSKDTVPMEKFSSVYTVDRFDGLVLQIDQYGGMGGSIRGFLSDGSVSYRNHHNVDGLAFGHCDYAYRNLGRMSKIMLKQDHGGFHVLVDDETCFSSNEIQLPTGYYFGVTAASAENPDSFEVSRFLLSTLNSVSREQPVRNRPQTTVEETSRPAETPVATPSSSDQQQQQQPVSGGHVNSDHMDQMLSLLEALAHSVADLKTDVTEIKRKVDEQGAELKQAIGDVPKHLPLDSISEIKRRADTIENTVIRIKNDVEGRDYKEHLTSLQIALHDTRDSLLNGLPQSMSQIITTSAPRLWLIVVIIVGFQLSLVGAYVVYKRRRANSPKKLL